VKLPTAGRHRAGPFDRAHGPEYAEWASREGLIIHIMPRDPAGHYPVKAIIFRTKEEAMVQKKAVKKVAKKSVKKGVKKGDVYQCGVCGLAVRIDETCGCVDACDIICCSKEMKPKKRA